jgi:O-antigen/teichoic acid export membrane protein
MSVMIKETLNRQIIKNSLLNFISRSFVLIISVVFIAYISRKLTKFELGIFAVMNIFMGIIPLIVGLGLATSAIRLVPELKAKGNFEKVSDIIKLTVGLPIPETILITLGDCSTHSTML